MAGLIEAATGFAAILTDIVNGTVTTGANFIVTALEDDPLAWVFPEGSTPTSVKLIPITAGHRAEESVRLWLRATFVARLDAPGEYLAIEKSIFALAITEVSARPAVRVEYDRDGGSEPDDLRLGVHRRSAAHVQIHGASEELAYVQAVSNLPLRRLDQFHIPVGGRRFRPTIEDFIEFLHAEQLIRLHDGWQDVIARHRGEWLKRQTRATVRGDPATAAEQLEVMGYRVVPPRSTTAGT